LFYFVAQCLSATNVTLFSQHNNLFYLTVYEISRRCAKGAKHTPFPVLSITHRPNFYKCIKFRAQKKEMFSKDIS
ncbi:MAG: hypothetical protein IKM58_04760, partial [Tidjanibacter sp.]|nr:hypothetical protein [Tidjanibacter sp.]